MNKLHFIIFLSFLSLVIIFPGIAADKMDADKVPGKYKMQINNDLYHGFEGYIEIIKLEKNMIYGNVGIDWRLGPEARKPMDWEIQYIIPFEAKLKDNNFKFKAEVAGKFKKAAAVYYFDLNFINAGKIKGKADIIKKNNKKNNSMDCEVNAEKQE